MSRKLLFGIIIVLLITNIATFLMWTNEEEASVTLDEEQMEIDTKKAVATIDGEDITYNEWLNQLRMTHGKKELKKMIDRTVVEQLAHKNNITVNDKVIDREVSLLTSMQGIMTKEELEKSEKKWRKDILYRYQLESLLTMDVMIAEEEAQSYFDMYGDQYNLSDTVQVSHIIVPTMEIAEKVKQELDDGAAFPLLAQEYSIDEETKGDGGYLGYFIYTSQFLPNGYYEQASQMEERTYSEPFKTDQGIAIIYLHQHLSEIKFTYEEIKPYIKNELALEKMEQTLTADSLWDKLDVDWVYEE